MSAKDIFEMHQNSSMTWLRSCVIVCWIIVATRCVQGEIRCFCNDASCVNKSYMCKSALGSCFVMLTTEGVAARTIHGCSDVLTPEVRVTCIGSEVNVGVPASSRQNHLMCCHEDMCNYNLEAGDGALQPSAKRLSAQPSATALMRSEQYNELLRGEVWFKAAVIAVPIAGLVILGLLVLLAVRMLSAESSSGSRRRVADISASQLDLSVKHFTSCSHVTDSYSHVTDNVCCIHELAKKNAKPCAVSHHCFSNCAENKTKDNFKILNERTPHGYTPIQTHPCSYSQIDCCSSNTPLTPHQTEDRTDISDVETV